jgi:hypothetical protein
MWIIRFAARADKIDKAFKTDLCADAVSGARFEHIPHVASRVNAAPSTLTCLREPAQGSTAAKAQGAFLETHAAVARGSNSNEIHKARTCGLRSRVCLSRYPEVWGLRTRSRGSVENWDEVIGLAGPARADRPTVRCDPSYAFESCPPWWRLHRSPERRRRHYQEQPNRAESASSAAGSGADRLPLPIASLCQASITNRRPTKHQTNRTAARPANQSSAGRMQSSSAGRRHRR